MSQTVEEIGQNEPNLNLDQPQLSQYVGMARLSSGNYIIWSGLTGFVGIVPSDLVALIKSGKFDQTYK